MKTASRRRKATEAGTAIRMRLAPVELIFIVVMDVLCGGPGTWDEVFDVLVVASDGGDVVAGGGVVVGGGGGVMMVSCGHAELLVWILTSARCNQLVPISNSNSRPRNLSVLIPRMQYLTRCSQDFMLME